MFPSRRTMRERRTSQSCSSRSSARPSDRSLCASCRRLRSGRRPGNRHHPRRRRSPRPESNRLRTHADDDGAGGAADGGGATAAALRARRGATRRPEAHRPCLRSMADDQKFYLTTAIDYANGDPHFGHALEKIGADAIARVHRQLGRQVHFLIGMDEHGQKVAQTAAAQGVEPQAFVDGVAATFRSTWDRLGISYDQFIRTTDPSHKSGVRAFIKRIHESSPDDFYEKEYQGWYCVGCELFKRDDEIVDGKCVLHPTRELQWTREKNWFFRLTRYEGFLKRLFAERPGFLRPESRRNEILALLD